VWAVSFERRLVAAIDPASNGVTTSLSLDGGAATALAVDRLIWIAAYANSGGSSLTRVNGKAAEVTRTFDTGELCCDLSAGDGGCGRSIPGVPRCDSMPAPERSSTGSRSASTGTCTSTASTPRVLLVLERHTPLSRLDAASGETATFDVGGGVPFLARDGLVWGASPDEVWAVDDATRQVGHGLGQRSRLPARPGRPLT